MVSFLTFISISAAADLLVDFPLFCMALGLLTDVFEKTNIYKGELLSWALNRRIAAHFSVVECSVAIPKSFFLFRRQMPRILSGDPLGS